MCFINVEAIYPTLEKVTKKRETRSYKDEASFREEEEDQVILEVDNEYANERQPMEYNYTFV